MVEIRGFRSVFLGTPKFPGMASRALLKGGKGGEGGTVTLTPSCHQTARFCHLLDELESMEDVISTKGFTRSKESVESLD